MALSSFYSLTVHGYSFSINPKLFGGIAQLSWEKYVNIGKFVSFNLTHSSKYIVQLVISCGGKRKERRRQKIALVTDIVEITPQSEAFVTLSYFTKLKGKK